MSLRAKLIWPILVFITAIFVASKGYTSYTAYQSSKHELIEQTRKLINNVSYSIKDALTTKNKRKAQTILADLLEQPNVSRVKLYDRANEPFVVLEGSGESAPVPNQNERSKLNALGYALSAKFLYVLEPIIHEGHVIGSIRVTLSHIPIINAQHSFLKDAGILLLILAAGGIIFYITIDRIILRPLLDLNGAIQDVTFGNASHVQIRHHSKDELGEVIHAFNRMMTKLRKREKQRQHSLATLEQKRAFSEEVIESIQYALVITDNLGTIIHSNVATQHIFQKTPEALENANIRDLIKTKMPNELSQILSRCLECDDIHLQNIDNEQQLSLTTRRLSNHGYLLFAIQDITEIEEAMNRQRVAGRVFEASQDGLIVLNHKGVITMVNPAVTKLVGLEIDQLVGQSFIQTIRWRKLQEMMPSIIESIENYGVWQGEVIEQNHLGLLVPMFARVNRIVKCEDNGFYDLVIILTDLSNAKEMERLEYLAHHDALTGLANRSKFHLELEDLVQRSGYQRDEFAVLYLDLDGFKEINDTYGHDAGDEVLKRVADRLTSATRHSDLIARLSGDEFVMLVNPANQKVVTRIAEQLLESICAPIEYKGNELKVGVSIGVKLVGVNERDATRILKSADTAMYQAKKAGKGQAILMGCELQETV
ncbi:diguanylate cyclase [Vibrio parahaemolyticus]|uniref:diguanylate cyclase domain-containing protein n=1 Tax=Vibrio parahaemolyticus TaxID=670 RepID=UPI001B84329F|nr:diguanylate cyclase [Vibrio parahaemolyticus]EJC1075520.1 diguanylate cyclase [Vibrio parahaemolyticus]EJK2180938.1 diguanylate cyclase [Vibrio parahaemolyticus]ELA7768422.1 diguanylate cyclase [Vibrio parahaemolyticus]MDF4981992.1 diguanylate cyclase [Vibrio parahaemolyticus]HAV1400700.1 diguanylate cyclase [Vibrio parahaemolyticus]